MKKFTDIPLGEWVLACRDVKLEDYADFAQYWDTPLGQMRNDVLESLADALGDAPGNKSFDSLYGAGSEYNPLR